MPSTPSIYRDQLNGISPLENQPLVLADTHAHGDGHGDVHGNADGHHPHVISPLVLIATFAALIVLTGLTVGVTSWDFGYNINLIVALSIAVVKAVLVVMYFMHLRYDSPFYSVIVTLCLVFIGIFIVFTILDSGAYAPVLTPTNIQPG